MACSPPTNLLRSLLATRWTASPLARALSRRSEIQPPHLEVLHTPPAFTLPTQLILLSGHWYSSCLLLAVISSWLHILPSMQMLPLQYCIGGS